jgi:hypothetical protein
MRETRIPLRLGSGARACRRETALSKAMQEREVGVKGEVGSMQRFSRLHTVVDASTLLAIIAGIAVAAWLLAHSG